MTKQFRGSIALLVLTMLYGFYGVYNRMIGDSFAAFSQNWVRNGIIIIFILLYFLITNKKFVRLRKEDIFWIAVWMLSGSSIMVLLFQAFNHLPLSTAYFLFYSTMIISGFLSGTIFFREKLNFIKIISIMLAFLGLVFIYSLSVQPDDIRYVLYTLLSGLLLGFWNTISKKFSDNYPNMQIIFLDSVAAVLVGLFGALLVREAIPQFSFSSAWLWITLYAITQIIAVGLVVYGFKNLEAQIGSIIMPVEVIFATIFGLLIFKEIPTASALLGGILIASAALLPNIQLLLESKKQKIIY